MGGRVAQSCWLLITLSLKGILAGDWSVLLPSSPICAVIGSSVVIPCSYDYPQSSNETKEEGRLSTQGGAEEQYRVLAQMWCREDSRCITSRYVFHSDGIFSDQSYQNRVEYLGQPGTKNCSLRISDLRLSDSGSYVFYLITSHPTQKMPEQRGIHLLVADSSGAIAASASPSSDVTEGMALHLACCSPAAGPQAQFTWYKSTSTSLRHTGPVWDISNVTSGDSGSYYCQIQTGDKVQKSAMLPVDVEYCPRNTAVSGCAAEQQHGLPVNLTCSSDANPPVLTYTWYQGAACLPTADKSSHQARHSTATPSGPTHSSTSIIAEGSAQYCCVARNRHGSQSLLHINCQALNPSESLGARLIIIGVTIVVILAIMGIVACVTRKRKSSRQHSYVLAETAATAL